MTTPRIILIRHGDTEWSQTGQHTSRTEIPLSHEGRSAARQLAERLQAFPITRVLSSPRVRSRQTCEFAGMADRMEMDSDLTEWDYGSYEGLTSPEILEARPGWNLFSDGCPGGESLEQISDRADRVISGISNEGEVTVVFTHGHFGRVIGARWIGLAAAEGRRLLLDPVSISLLGFEHGNPRTPVLALWNATDRCITGRPTAGAAI
jgi:probable phosphoglycerate mutase